MTFQEFKADVLKIDPLMEDSEIFIYWCWSQITKQDKGDQT